MSVATRKAQPITDPWDLAPRFRGALDRVRPALRSPFEAYADSLESALAAVHRVSVASLDALGARLPAEHADDEPSRQALLLALEAARRDYTDAVLAALASDALGGTDGRAEEIVATVLEVTEGIGAAFPEMLRVEQEGVRFEPAPADPRHIRVLKTGKRVLRLVWKRWSRAIPVADLARYHTAVFEQEAGGPFAELRRLRTFTVSGVYRLFRATLQALDEVRGVAFLAATAGSAAAPADLLEDQRALLDALADELRFTLRRDARAVEEGVDDAVLRTMQSFASALVTTGTIERPARTVSALRARRLRDRTRIAREDAFAAWERCEHALTESIAGEAEVTRVAAAARLLAAGAVTALHEAVEQRVHAPLATLHGALAEIDRDADSLLARRGDLTGSLEALQRAIQNAFAHGAPLTDDGDGVWADITLPLHTLDEELSRMPEAVQAARSVAPLPLDHLPARPPKVSLKSAPVRRLVELVLVRRLHTELAALLEGARPELDETRAEIRRIRQAAAYNVAAALRGARDTADDEAPAARELVSGVLERAIGRLDGQVDTVAGFEASLVGDLRERVDAATAGMVESVRTRNAIEISERVMFEATRKRVDTSLVSGRRALAAGLAWSRTAGVSAWAGVRRSWTRARLRLGFAEVEKVDVLTSLDQSRLDGRITDGLPHIYRQLFALEPLEWDDFLVGRERDLESVRQAYARWRDGQPASLMVHGEKGSGKTTLINAARRAVLDDGTPISVVRPARRERTEAALAARLAEALALPATASLDALARQIDASHRRIVIVEDAQSLLLRTIGGFDVLHAFLTLVATTSRHIFWVVSLGQYTWHYLGRVIAIQDRFGFEIDTTTLQREAIEAAILTRHTVSGYALRFEPDDRLRASRRWRRLRTERARQETARHHFFDQLARIAEGNVFVALFYWLRSIRAVEEHTLVFDPPRVIDARFLEHLPLETLHTVAAIIQHGSLSEAEHAAIFQLEPAGSRLHLSALADSYLLFHGEDGRYVLNKVLYRPFVRLLKAKNAF